MTATQAPAQRQASVPQRVVDAVNVTGSFEKMLPAPYKPMAERMLTRAKLYLSKKPELHSCTVGSLVQCVLSAGEWGLCLDGKMAHAVKFGVKKKDQNNREYWEDEAVFMPDYKGILDMARRHSCISDGYVHHYYEGDRFDYSFENGRWNVIYQPNLANRGAYIGTWVCLVFDNGRYVVEYMTKDEIELIRQKSKSKDRGPWVTDWPEMAKKTVLKRALKRYVTDPEVADLLDRDDSVTGRDDLNEERQSPGERPRSLNALADRFTAPKAIEHAPVGQRYEAQDQDDDYAPAMSEPPTINEQPPQHQPPDEPSSDVYMQYIADIQNAENRTALNKLAGSVDHDPNLDDLERQNLRLEVEAKGKAFAKK